MMFRHGFEFAIHPDMIVFQTLMWKPRLDKCQANETAVPALGVGTVVGFYCSVPRKAFLFLLRSEISDRSWKKQMVFDSQSRHRRREKSSNS